jgi:hypothetical protein
MFRALLVLALILTACGDHVGSGSITGTSPGPNPSDPIKPTPTSTPVPSPTAPTVAFPARLALVVGTYDGLVYPQLIDGKPAGTPVRGCDGQVSNLAAWGRKVLVICREPTYRLSIFDPDAGTLSVIPGVEALEATWTTLGDSVVYTAIGACEPPAPICKTKLMQRELRTGVTTQLDERYGVGRDLRSTGEGVTVWRGMNMDSFVRLADEVGTWVVRGTTLSRFSQHRLIDGGKGRDLFETEETSFHAGCCTVVMTGYQQQAQRLTPSSVSNERAIALLEDGRIVAFRPDSKNNLFVGSVVVYRAGVVERSDRGSFSPYLLVRDVDWIVSVEYGAGGTLRAYRISDGAFASASSVNVTALVRIGPAKPPIP